MSEWKEKQFCELVDIGSSKRIFYKEYVPVGIPFYRSKEVIEKHNGKAISTELHISIEKYNDIKEKFGVPVEGDILLTSVGTLGIPYLVQKDEKFYFKDGNLTWFWNFNNSLLNQFLYYWLISPLGKGELDMVSIGSTQPALTIRGLKGITINTPPLPEQKAIASVLSSLDDKIDLLHRQNKTLEAMAETLYRQWFVEEADEDWEEGCLGDVIELVYGKGLKKEIRTGTGYPVIGSSGVVGYHSDFLVESPGIVIGRKGMLGKVIYLWDNFFPIDTTYYIKSKVESVDLLYEYFLLKTLNFEEMNSDSAVPGLNRDIALSTEIKIAPLEKLQKFNQFTSTFINKLSENTKQIRTLEKLRDTLLPKLMSGEVRVQYDKELVE